MELHHHKNGSNTQVNKYLQKYATKLDVGVTYQDLGSTAAGYISGQVSNAMTKTTSLPQAFDGLRQTLTQNLRYWGGKSNDAIWDSTAADMKRKTANMLKSLTELEDELLCTATQDQLTQDCTNGMMWLSMVAGFAPGVGTASSTSLDSLSFIFSATNDTRNAVAMELVKKFIGKYGDYITIDQKYKELVKELSNGEDNCDEEDPLKNKDAKVNPVYDPSGVVYEAVLSNAVKDATVTLYYAQNGAAAGDYIQQTETEQFTGAVQTLHDDTPWLGQSNPLITGANGKYAWDVPTGLWYVEATADGYEPGNSGADTAASITANGKNWLPVLPPQLEVNIPLVDHTNPTIKEVLYKTDGVYITFSKYMDEAELKKDNFTLTDGSGQNITFTLEKLDSEQAPANIDYNGAEAGAGTPPSYTRSVKLSAALQADANVYLVADDTKLISYAGSSLVSGTQNGTVTAPSAAATPAASPADDAVTVNTPVTLSTTTSGAVIYYTTDGTTPTTDSAVYTSSISVGRAMTIKAIAVKGGYTNSAEFSASYTVTSTTTPVAPGTDPDPDPNPGTTPSGGGGGGGGAATVPVSGSGSSISVTATVSGGTAVLNIDAKALQTVIESSENSGNVTIDLTALGQNISAAVLKSESWQALSDAAESSANSTTGLTVKLDTGSLSFDAKALKAAAGGDVTVSLKQADTAGMSASEKTMVGDRPVYDISVLSGTKNISDLKGGSITVSVPYTPKAGEDTSKLVIWHINAKGELEAVACKYANGSLTFTLTHLSEYILAYFPFKDVASGVWYYGDVAYAYMAGLMNGTGADSFAPASSTSRAMIVTMLYRLEGEPAVTAASSFADVASGKWYEKAVKWAAANGIVSGYASGGFGPDDDITREQLAAILYRYAKYKGYDVSATADLAKFGDSAKISSYAKAPLSWANAKELINGTGSGTLDPSGSAQRCQVAAILHRFCEYVEK